MDRDRFLSRVREAAQAGRAHRVHLPANIPERPSYCGAGPEPLERFISEVNQVGGEGKIVDTPAGLRQELLSIFERHAVRTVLGWQHPLLTALELHAALATAGIEWLDHARLTEEPEPERLRKMLACGGGVSSVRWAIAETGTLAMEAAPGNERLASLAPPVHVAIVSPRQILADLYDLFDTLVPQEFDDWSSNWTLITGPSKTGDLELRLTTGVHGPRHWHVLALRHDVAFV